MREGHHFHCPECQVTSPAGATCDECGVAMIDELGNPAHPVARKSSWRGLPTLFGVCAGYAAACAWPLLGTWTAPAMGIIAGSGLLVEALGWGVPAGLSGWRRRQRARALLAQAPDSTRIVDAHPGVAHVAGRVRVLGHATFAACDAPGAERGSWRFALTDGSGAAVIDDDCVEIWQAGLRRCGGVVEDGAYIEVVGRARLDTATDAELADGYRGRSVLTFEGTPESPILLVRAPAPT